MVLESGEALCKVHGCGVACVRVGGDKKVIRVERFGAHGIGPSFIWPSTRIAIKSWLQYQSTEPSLSCVSK